jgi:hypothetical protein
VASPETRVELEALIGDRECMFAVEEITAPELGDPQKAVVAGTGQPSPETDDGIGNRELREPGVAVLLVLAHPQRGGAVSSQKASEIEHDAAPTFRVWLHVHNRLE